MGEQLRAVPNHGPPGPTTILQAKHRPEKLAQAGRGVRRGHQHVPGHIQLGYTPSQATAGAGTGTMCTHTRAPSTPGLHTHNLYTGSHTGGLYTLTCMHPHSNTVGSCTQIRALVSPHPHPPTAPTYQVSTYKCPEFQLLFIPPMVHSNSRVGSVGWSQATPGVRIDLPRCAPCHHLLPLCLYVKNHLGATHHSYDSVNYLRPGWGYFPRYFP